MPLDHWFGTFREKLGDSKLYTGEAKSTIRASPFKVQTTVLFNVYYAVSMCFFAAFALAVTEDTSYPYTTSAALAFGPLVLGMILYIVSGDAESPRWPFHKEPVIGGLHQSFGFNASVGFIVGVLPVYQFATAMLATCSTCA